MPVYLCKRVWAMIVLLVLKKKLFLVITVIIILVVLSINDLTINNSLRFLNVL